MATKPPVDEKLEFRDPDEALEGPDTTSTTIGAIEKRALKVIVGNRIAKEINRAIKLGCDLYDATLPDSNETIH